MRKCHLDHSRVTAEAPRLSARFRFSFSRRGLRVGLIRNRTSALKQKLFREKARIARAEAEEFRKRGETNIRVLRKCPT